MNRNKELEKNIIIFGIGTIGSKLVQFLLIPLYTLYLSTSDYSTSDLVSSTVTMIIPFFTLGLGHGILRFALGKKREGESIICFSFIIILLGSLVLFLLVPVLKLLNIFDGREIYIPILFFVNALSDILSNYCKSLEKNLAYSLNGILTSFVLGVSNWLFIVNYKLGIDGYLLACIFAKVISVVYLVVECRVFHINPDIKKEGKLIKKTLRYSIPLMPNDLAWWIIQMSDRYMVTFICGATINGIYSVAYKIPGIFNLLVSIFISAFSITVFKEVDSSNSNGKIDEKYFETLFNQYLAITFVVASLVILATRPIAYIFIKEDFYESWKYTPFLLIAFVFGNLEAFLGSILSGFKKTTICFYSTLSGAVVNVIFNYFLIPIFKVYGAIIATIVSYCIVYLVRLVGVKKYANIYLYFAKTAVSLLLIFFLALCYVSTNVFFNYISISVAIIIVIIYKVELKMTVLFFVAKARNIIFRLFSK